MKFFKDKEQYTDQELLMKYREKREQHLLAGLFTRYTHLVYGVCLKYLRNTEDASDAVMNIYEKLSSNIHRHEIIKFSTWLYVISKNHCLMELRKRKSLEHKQEVWQEEQLLFMESESFLHPIDEDTEVHTQQLKLCLEQLKREQKSCIELFYYQNKCYLEISDILKIEEKTVKSHLQNGKRNLKICIANSYVKEKAS